MIKLAIIIDILFLIKKLYYNETKNYFYIIREKQINFLDDDINILDIFILNLNLIRLKQFKKLIIWWVNVYVGLIIWFFFIIWYVLSIFTILITILFNIDHDIEIKTNFFNEKKTNSFFPDTYVTLFQIIIDIFKLVFSYSRIYSFITIYLIIAKKTNFLNFSVLNKITISQIYGFPWILIFISFCVSDMPWPNYTFKKKIWYVKPYIYIKDYFKKWLDYFNSYTMKTIIMTKGMKIIINKKKITLNGFKFMLFDFYTEKKFGLKNYIYYYQTLKGKWVPHQCFLYNNNTNIIYANILTHSNNILVKNINYKNTMFYKTNELKQYICPSLINVKENNFKEGILKSVWVEHNLNVFENFLSFQIRGHVFYHMQECDKIIVQEEKYTDKNILHFKYGKQDVYFGHMYLNNPINKKIISYKDWENINTYVIRNNYKLMWDEMQNMNNIELSNYMIQLSDENVNIKVLLNMYRFQHNNLMDNYNKQFYDYKSDHIL